MRLAIAKITKPHGVKGEVRVVVLLDSPELFCRVKQAYLGERKVKISARRADDQAIVRIEGVLNRDDADLLRGKFLEVDRADTDDLKRGEFFISDLIGLRVFVGGACVGEITDVYQTARSADVLAIKGEKEIMIPFLKKLNASACLEEKTIAFDEEAFKEAAVYEN